MLEFMACSIGDSSEAFQRSQKSEAGRDFRSVGPRLTRLPIYGCQEGQGVRPLSWLWPGSDLIVLFTPFIGRRNCSTLYFDVRHGCITVLYSAFTAAGFNELGGERPLASARSIETGLGPGETPIMVQQVHCRFVKPRMLHAELVTLNCVTSRFVILST